MSFLSAIVAQINDTLEIGVPNAERDGSTVAGYFNDADKVETEINRVASNFAAGWNLIVVEEMDYLSPQC